MLFTGDPIVYMNYIDAGPGNTGWHSQTLTGMAGAKLCPTVQGSGSASWHAYFGPFDPAIVTPPTPPAGYGAIFPGWVANDGGIPSLGGAQGSMTVAGNTCSVGLSDGMAQAGNAAWAFGGWMMMLQCISFSAFAIFVGGGAAIVNADFASWMAHGSNNAGGGVFSDASIPTRPTLAGRNITSYSSPVGWTPGQRVMMAVAMPAFESTFIPQSLVPFHMPCVGCCPTPCNSKFV